MKNTLKKLATKTLMAAPFFLPSLGLAQQPIQHNNYATLAPVVVDSTDYNQKLATYGLDDYYYMDDLIQRQMIADGIKNPTQETLSRYAKKIHQNALKGSPDLDHIVGMGVRNLGDGKKEIVYFMNESRTKTVSVDNMRTDLNYTLAEVNAAAQQIPVLMDDCNDCDNNLPIQQPQNKTKKPSKFNFVNNIVAGYTQNIPLQTSQSDDGAKYGGNIHLSVPFGNRLNLEVAYTLGYEKKGNDNIRTVEQEVQTNSGRVFQEGTYSGFNYESSGLGKIGLSYDVVANDNVSVTLGAGVNVQSQSLSEYSEKFQEAFFDENNDGVIDLENEYVGDGTFPDQFLNPSATSEKLIGLDGFVQFTIPHTGLGARVGATYTPDASISVDDNFNITKGAETTVYAGLVYRFGGSK